MDSLVSTTPLPVLIVLAAFAAVGLVRLFWKVEDRLTEKRKRAAKLNSTLNEYGHTLTSKIRDALAVGDLPSVWAEIDRLLDTLENPKLAQPLLQADLLSQLAKQLAMGDAAPAILKHVAAFVAANPAVAKAAGLALLVV